MMRDVLREDFEDFLTDASPLCPATGLPCSDCTPVCADRHAVRRPEPISSQPLNDYQNDASVTADYPGRGSINGLVYCALGMAGEAGEFADKVKKILRDDGGELTPERKVELCLECGDVLWYCAEAAWELGMTLQHVAQENTRKLFDRKRRGCIGGSGDNR